MVLRGVPVLAGFCGNAIQISTPCCAPTFRGVLGAKGRALGARCFPRPDLCMSTGRPVATVAKVRHVLIWHSRLCGEGRVAWNLTAHFPITRRASSLDPGTFSI